MKNRYYDEIEISEFGNTYKVSYSQKRNPLLKVWDIVYVVLSLYAYIFAFLAEYPLSSIAFIYFFTGIWLLFRGYFKNLWLPAKEVGREELFFNDVEY
ncbi:hypothetical protein [Tenacibaculum sp. 190524A02b]|uniref:hypothetical protein n=1 Tax=Tenacibaculum vairaonense TaxID=3137860 RepID=UPI0031FA8E0A